MPDTSTRNQDLKNVLSKGKKIALVMCGSNPNSSTEYSPAIRVRTNSETAAMPLASSLGPSSVPDWPEAPPRA